ncbi:LacI family DNA-binding transcriptional regulator, partial [Nocardioides sp.]|uniref:LacI family DNA-binding transcriptional regulator n=1 Tax=Nocardioides sp. TaxID=35761 RepID=UPI0027331A4E
DHVVANSLCGVVLTTTTVDSVLPVRLQDRGVPFVYFNRTASGVRADSVTVDPEPGMRDLVAAIVKHGHDRVGAVFGPRNTSTGEEREQTLRALMEEYGVTLRRAHLRHGPFDVETGQVATRELLALDDPPTLIVCGNDVVALGALNAAAEAGVEVPDELSIVGFDDLPMSRWALIQLSTVAYDLDAMSREAARMVVARVEQGSARPLQATVLPTRFVQRRTLGPAPR